MEQIKESSVSVFAKKLYTLLHDVSYQHLVTWNEDGTVFIIRDQATFQAQLFPHYFKNNHFNSFVRQLNMYGFRRISDGRKLRKQFVNSSSFIHSSFQKNRPDLLAFINRVSNRIKEVGKPIRNKVNPTPTRRVPRTLNDTVKPYPTKIYPAIPSPQPKVDSASDLIVRSNAPFTLPNSSFNSPTEADFSVFNGSGSFDSDNQQRPQPNLTNNNYNEYACYTPTNELQYQEPQNYNETNQYTQYKESNEIFKLDNYLVNQQSLHLNLINQLQALANRGNY